MARPRAQLPDDEIAYRGRQGQGEVAVLAALTARGIEVDKRTVGRRLAELRAAGWPGADAYAAKVMGGKASLAGAAVAGRPAGGSPPASASPLPGSPVNGQPGGAAGQADEDAEAQLSAEDLERLPAALLAAAARETSVALRRALDAREVVSVDKLASVLERFSRRLVEVRPPEKVEPVKDPTNLQARREVLARWEALREPYEIALPVIEAIEAHAAALRQKMEQRTS